VVNKTSKRRSVSKEITHLSRTHYVEHDDTFSSYTGTAPRFLPFQETVACCSSPPSLAPSLSEFEIRRRCFTAFQLLQPPSSSRALSATIDLLRQSIVNDTSGVTVILVWRGRVLYQLPGRFTRPLELCGQRGRQTASQSPSIPKSTRLYSSHGIQRPSGRRSICKSRTLSARVRSHPLSQTMTFQD
jgi:hypothetical protein